ncbi:Protein CBG26300 [Caenorhabditis briggsae]|uniref:Protein CBG26300 n=1 Tax=Caenorhabditis briggsae TaxID=6238 RepID=B6IG73_CAEBR|nr:Protein CBG26300 [Caenorhabditis briggsae]CAR98903.1 Protein CBG26300 [Caenorhabditis briggsae]
MPEKMENKRFSEFEKKCFRGPRETPQIPGKKTPGKSGRSRGRSLKCNPGTVLPHGFFAH